MVIKAIAASTALTAVLAIPAAAQSATYENARFAYAIEIPAGFSTIVEADNSDGGTSRSVDGAAELAVWGANRLDESFGDEVKSRIASDAADGWSVSYRTVSPKAASWSGAKGGRIFYARAIPACDGQSAFIRLEYDRDSAKAFDPVVKRLVSTLKATRRCQ